MSHGRQRLPSAWFALDVRGYRLPVTTHDHPVNGRPKWRRGMFRGSQGMHATEWAQRHWSSRVLHRVGEAVAHASTGILSAALVVAWTIVGLATRFPGWWQTVLYSVTGAVTFVMVFVIQHTQQRQVAATQRKLDELIRSSAEADPTLIAVEEAPDDDLANLARLHVAEREQAQHAD
jgi:low affinity Fe/Cu permease